MLIFQYFTIWTKYKKLYGDLTLILLRNGHFYEIYGLPEHHDILQYVSNICNLTITKKNKSKIEVNMSNCYMLGVQYLSVEKYIKILLNNGFTIVIIDQTSPPPKPTRHITEILTPGTYIDNTIDNKYILSIYIEQIKQIKNQNILAIGLAVIDLSTSKSIINESYSQKDDDKVPLDECIRFMHSFQSNEIVLTTNNIETDKLNDLIAYLEITDKHYYHKTIDQLINTDGRKSLFKISYQEQLLKKVFPHTSNMSTIEYLNLELLNYGRLAYVILLNYAYDHSHSIIGKLHIPNIYEEHQYINLGNNSIYQLNILDFDKNNQLGLYNNKIRYRSLFDILNQTSTPMGRRMLKINLTQPPTNIEIIRSRYNFIRLISESNIYGTLEQLLIGINDIEKQSRKIALNIINPIEFYSWINSIGNSVELFNYMYENNLLIDNFDIKSILINSNTMLAHISKYIQIEELQKYLINDINGCIFQKNIFTDIDLLNERINKCSKYMEAITYGLSNYLDKQLQTKTDGNLIKMEYNDRDGHFLLLTKRRCEILETIIKRDNKINFLYDNISYEISASDLEFKHLPKGGNSKIFIKDIIRNSTKMVDYQDQLKIIQKEYFIDFLNKLNKYEKLIEQIYQLIAIIDYLKSGAKCANKFHYTIPTINNLYENKSYFKATDLRHPIIEQINTDKEYIPTTIELGTEKQDGILLFGLNSSGKSSLQKSIGIAIVIAQMGYPVPAKSFDYYPYYSLLTRISSNDNIFKGLSSFALEMSELRAILKRSNKNTLVICDELCKGTEHKSSIIIVTTMLEVLAKNSTSFITATHLHEICSFNRINHIKNIKLYHLHVNYDEITNTITYDRILKEGSGESFYGLNVAKYLISDNNFMDLANDIKKEVFEIPDLYSNKISNYNSNLYMDKCQICNHQVKRNEIPLETHHIMFQKDFINGINQNKYHIQKNHKANLVVLCYKCHDKIDTNEIIINGWKDSNKNCLDYYICNNKQTGQTEQAGQADQPKQLHNNNFTNNLSRS
jgi:DNA mismatch repair protein MutS